MSLFRICCASNRCVCCVPCVCRIDGDCYSVAIRRIDDRIDGDFDSELVCNGKCYSVLVVVEVMATVAKVIVLLPQIVVFLVPPMVVFVAVLIYCCRVNLLLDVSLFRICCASNGCVCCVCGIDDCIDGDCY